MGGGDREHASDLAPCKMARRALALDRLGSHNTMNILQDGERLLPKESVGESLQQEKSEI